MNNNNKIIIDSYNHSKFVINPDNLFKLIFDLTGLFIVIYQTITTPFIISFNFENKDLINFDYFCDVFFIIDFTLNFNTGFYKEGVLIMNRKEICINYLKTWMAFDCLSSFPYSFILDNLNFVNSQKSIKNAPRILRVIKIIKFIKILRLLRMVKFRNVFYKLEDTLTSDKIHGIYIYFKTLIIFFFVWHFLACILTSISLGEFEENFDSIVAYEDLPKKEVSYAYGVILYYIFTTFFTIGYGDIKPKSVNEKLFAMFLMLLSYGLFCYMVSIIRNIIQRSLEIEQELRAKLRDVKLFFKEKNLPSELTKKVSKYMEFVYTEKESKRLDDSDIFALLNDKLGNELRIQMNKKILQSLKILKQKQFDGIVNLMCNCVYEEIINPSEIIFSEGELISKRMYFLEKGNVLLYHDVTTVILKELGVKKYNLINIFIIIFYPA